MRLAIISDIHANLEALTKTFELIDKRKVDQILCLGDIVGYGADPGECLRLVRDRCQIVIIGNHDLAAVDVTAAEEFNATARIAAQWTNGILPEEEKQSLKSLPYTAVLDDLFFVHGSPYEPEEFHYILSTRDAVDAMDFFEQKMCFIGHSHVPGIFTKTGRASSVDSEGRYLINVGSVGQPRDGNPKLSFGILNTEEWTYENIRAVYDIERAARKIIAAGLPPVLGERLMVGM
ncbi:MAG: metallophosphoesterase family protein [Bacteroidota bacterium]